MTIQQAKDLVKNCGLNIEAGDTYNECENLILAALAYAQAYEDKEKGCEYCNGKTPLTDKVYEDGTKFDDLHGNRIDKFGKVFVIKSYVKDSYCKLFAPSMDGVAWAEEIKYCPKCGRELR